MVVYRNIQVGSAIVVEAMDSPDFTEAVLFFEEIFGTEFPSDNESRSQNERSPHLNRLLAAAALMLFGLLLLTDPFALPSKSKMQRHRRLDWRPMIPQIDVLCKTKMGAD
jgi:hypothetical protein